MALCGGAEKWQCSADVLMHTVGVEPLSNGLAQALETVRETAPRKTLEACQVYQKSGQAPLPCAPVPTDPHVQG